MYPGSGFFNNGHFGIKVHSLAKERKDTDFLDPVTQLQGKGASVSPPIDRPYVINNVIRPFKAESEVHRQRATQILDYIIMRRKMAAKRQTDLEGTGKEDESLYLIEQIEQEKMESRFMLGKTAQT
jgi:hypothetical protein